MYTSLVYRQNTYTHNNIFHMEWGVCEIYLYLGGIDRHTAFSIYGMGSIWKIPVFRGGGGGL